MDEFTRSRTNNAFFSPSEPLLDARGPIDPAGYRHDLSDRPLICSSSNMRNEVVIGGSDHALYAIDINDRNRPPVTMYTKNSGHTDWVTCVTHLASGQVLSGAMDGKLCLWSQFARNRCVELVRDNTQPISKVISDVRYNNALSCSYDGNIELWRLPEQDLSSASSAVVSRRVGGSQSRQLPGPQSSGISAAATMTGHTQPVIDLAFRESMLASGDKSGSLMLWDLNRAQPLHRFRAHPSAITCVDFAGDRSIVVTAGTEGCFKVWDPRAPGSGMVMKVPAHGDFIPGESKVSTSSSGRAHGSSGRAGGRTTATARGRGGNTSASSHPYRGGATDGPTPNPISVMSVVHSRGSSTDACYVITGGGSAADSRLVLTDLRYTREIVAEWDHHRNGIYSLCLVSDDCVLSGDGVGTLLCHQILSGDALKYPRNCLKYGLGASEQGAIRSINCLGGKVVTTGEDGKALIFDFQ